MRFGRNNPNYLFTDIQAGNIIGGAGVGVAFYKQRFGEWQKAPRISLFGGIMLWGTYDIVFDPTINPDLGLNIMFALPDWSRK
ncbi:MAG: hypothetical protein HQ556_10725 [Candidatus Marinimicrobia bacterium]|nr:hypothetical protein [Candidatus Neomarinimicrobiota bacterium]